MISSLGAGAIALCRHLGGMVLLTAHVAISVATLRFDRRELGRQLAKMGAGSLPIVVLTAFFTGGIMIIQSGIFVRRFNAYGLLGFGAGYATLREVGPILIALMFSGRVGANNAAELGTMTVTEQLDGLRMLAIDPIDDLIAPRVVAMIVSLFALTVVGDAVALGGGALFARALMNVEYSTLWHSLVDHVHLADFTAGLIKAATFGLAISVTSCHFGTSVVGGAVGVGRAVNAAVVSAALAVVVGDNLITMVIR